MESVKVDDEKFRKELKRRGLHITAISKEMGYGKSSISEAIRRGKLHQTQALLIEKMYNIKPEDYAPAEEISGGGRKFHRSITTKYTKRYIAPCITR